MASILRVNMQRCFSPPAFRAYFAEFISTFLFEFTAVGSAISARMVTSDIASGASSLVATAIAQAFGLFAAVFIATDVSGGHVNPAVTFAFTIGGHISVPSAMLYCANQMLGSTFACLVLHYISAGQAVPTTRIAVEMTGFGAAVLEGVMTFMLVYTVLVARDPRDCGCRKRLAEKAMGGLVVGVVTGACVLAAGSLTGASLNPARSFGPAVVSEHYNNQAVYWAGPLLGAAVAALVHQYLVFPSMSEEPLRQEPRHGSVEMIVV